MKTLAPIAPDELKKLSRKFGEPQRAVCTLDGDPTSREKRADRRGEVVLAIRFRDGRILLHTKSFYPLGVFRLPTGGVDLDESISDALYREVEEETGLPVQVRQFVALIEYDINGMRDRFASYVFLMDTNGHQPNVNDVKERISAFKLIAPSELRAVAAQLRNLSRESQPWGKFRAPAHDLVADSLLNGGTKPKFEI